MNKVYLLLGSNQQNPKKQLLVAQKFISGKIGGITRRSFIYQTAAWGNTQQPDFLNQVIVVQTALTAVQTMQTILDIEKKMGRIRTKKNAPRVIDIDILFFNKEIIHTKELHIPHPRLQERNFVLIPLNQLSPNLKHPVFNKPINELLKASTDTLTVKKF
jgi:2-amino-4-hydroxy-6-hydroxymethyldihydropteridine diphosphokinase